VRLQAGVFAPFEAVDARAFLGACFEGAQSSLTHEPRFRQRRHTRDVDVAPVASWLPRRKPDHVGIIAEALSPAVVPAEAQRLVHRFAPRDGWLAAALLPEADEELRLHLVIRFEPCAQFIRCREECWLHARILAGRLRLLRSRCRRIGTEQWEGLWQRF